MGPGLDHRRRRPRPRDAAHAAAKQVRVAGRHRRRARAKPSFADTDWVEILGLYDLLAARWPSPVVALNRAVAMGFAHGPAAGLAALDELAAEPQLEPGTPISPLSARTSTAGSASTTTRAWPTRRR